MQQNYIFPEINGVSTSINVNTKTLEVSKWNKEFMLGFNLPSSYKSYTINSDGVTLNYNVFYSEKIKILPNGISYDFILNKNPGINTWTLHLQSNGLSFYYQPPLTGEYLAGWSNEFNDYITVSETYVNGTNGVLIHRLNPYGYAIYCDKVGGKYQTGKIMNIYRPIVIDASGHKIFGVLQYVNNPSEFILSVDSSFLNTATYPVTIDPDFGFTSKGNTAYSPGTDTLHGTEYTSPNTASMLGVSMSLFGYSASTNNAKMGMWVNSDGGAMVANAITPAVSMTTTDTIYTGTFAIQPSIAQNTAFMLATISNAGASTFYVWGDSSGGTSHRDTDNDYASPENFNWDINNSRKYSIYCTYTTGGASYTRTLTLTLDWVGSNTIVRNFTRNIDLNLTYVSGVAIQAFNNFVRYLSLQLSYNSGVIRSLEATRVLTLNMWIDISGRMLKSYTYVLTLTLNFKEMLIKAINPTGVTMLPIVELNSNILPIVCFAALFLLLAYFGYVVIIGR